MRIEQLLRDDAPAILDDAAPLIARLEHYRRDGEDATRRRVEALYRQIVRAVDARDLDDLLAHASRIARERLEAGFAPDEVEAAFELLEEAISRRAHARLPRAELAWELGLVGTACSHAKSELWRTFVSLAPRSRARGVDLTPLFKRSEPKTWAVAADEFVYPV